MHSLQKWGRHFHSVGLLMKESMENVSIATILLTFRRGFRRARFPIDQQLKLIDTFETYRGGRQTLPALITTREIYIETLGADSIPVKVLDSMREATYQGKSYVEGMREWFDVNLVMLYQVSLEAGSSGERVREMASELLDQRNIGKQMFAEFKMPLMITGLALGLLTVLTQIFLPIILEFTETLEGIGVSGVQWLSALLVNQGLLWVLSGACIYVFFKWLQPRWHGEQRKKVDHLFPFSLYRGFESARLIKLLALMRQSNLNLDQSLKRIAPLLSPYLSWHAEKIAQGLYEGRDKSDYFGEGLLTKYQMIRLRSYTDQSSSQLPQALESLSANANFDAKLSVQESIHTVKFFLLFFGICLLGIDLLALSEAISQFIVFVINQS